MKIGKENMVKLVYAPENYHQSKPDDRDRSTVTAAGRVEAISAIHGLYADIEQDEAGRAIWRIRVRVNDQNWGWNARRTSKRCAAATAIYFFRKYQLHQGVLASIHAR
ncbi:selenocysteine synthase [Salmonella enterica subsp. enterica]|nr:selenocysteine synthase [Salmonella enterica subsp. enterica]